MAVSGMRSIENEAEDEPEPEMSTFHQPGAASGEAESSFTKMGAGDVALDMMS